MRRVLELELGLVLLGEACEHAVEDVVVPLLGHLVDDAGLLEEVLLDLRALDDAVLVEDDVDVLAEAGGVVVADRLGVAEGWKRRKKELIR